MNRVRWLAGMISMTVGTTAAAEKLSIERIFSDPNLNGASPRSLHIAPDGSRVTFLRGKAEDQNQLDLWEYNLADKSTRLLVDSRALVADGNEAVSEAEKARRERQRTASFKGIVSYRWAPDSKKLLFPLGGVLYLYDLTVAPEKAVRPLTRAGLEFLDAQISPRGRYASFVSQQNLWAIDLQKGTLQQLTHDGGGVIHNAEAEFVAQEEMARASGYWWAPDDSAVAFERFDEARVPLVKRSELFADHTEVVEQRYPAAGDINVRVRLGVVSPKGGKPHWIDLGKNEDIYLARVNWLPDAQRLAVQRQSRDQRTLDLVLADARYGAPKIVLTETSKTWINLHDDLTFLHKQDAFIWASERSGYKQLYLYGTDGVLRHALSNGEWDIDKVLGIDEAAGKMYVVGNRDNALDAQIYALPLAGDGSAAPERISREDGWHDAVFADNTSLYVDTWSDPLTPPRVTIHAPDGAQLAIIEANTLDNAHPYASYRDALSAPEFGTVKAEDGQALYYRLYKPADFDASKKYPVFFRFYGGPGRQLVNRAWGDHFDQYMAQHGYVVFSLDNRGTPRRGRQFEDAIFKQMGNAEVHDQLAGIAYLKSLPYVDGKHIGVFGWSYGGYMALMMLAKASDQIAAGVAVAPVTDWRLYDSHYTERYLDSPTSNLDGYTASSVWPYLDGLKSPLLLVHGMADDNVLFTNSTKLMAELQNRGTQFELMTYPGGKHGLSTPAMRKHVFSLIAKFFDEKLKP